MQHENTARSTIEEGLTRARDEVQELERKFGADFGLLPERGLDPKPLVLKHRPWNQHCPGSVALAVLFGNELGRR
jgi:hypothetical protein